MLVHLSICLTRLARSERPALTASLAECLAPTHPPVRRHAYYDRILMNIMISGRPRHARWGRGNYMYVHTCTSYAIQKRAWNTTLALALRVRPTCGRSLVQAAPSRSSLYPCQVDAPGPRVGRLGDGERGRFVGPTHSEAGWGPEQRAHTCLYWQRRNRHLDPPA